MVDNLKNSKTPWLVSIFGSIIGLTASFVQTIERINYADEPLRALTCDINSAFSCSSVFDGWQSSFFGFSNSLVSLTFFAVILGFSLVGASGSSIKKYLRYFMHFFSVFFLFFGAWYLHQTTYSIGALCIFCIFNYAGVIMLNWAWLRINVHDLIANKQFSDSVNNLIKKGTDTFIWILWAILIAIMIISKYI